MVSTGTDKKANARVAAHLRYVICVSLRMAASAEAPLCPIVLPERLQRVGKVGRAREQACQWALTRKRTLWSWFECRAAYFSDCNVVMPLSPSAIAAAPSGPSQLCSRLQRGGVRRWGGEPCQRALTQANALGAAAHSSCWICVFLRTAVSAEAPSAPMWLPLRLQARGRMGTVRE